MKKITSGIIWSILERFSIQGIQLVLSLIIARLLLPSDYGIIAMLSVFINISQVFVDSGFSKALIQKQNRTEADYTTVFIFNIVISILIYIFLFLLSPLIAQFYNIPEIAKILRFSALSIVIGSSYAIQNTIIIINLEFKKLAKFSIASTLISGICGVLLAYLGYGVWALVFQPLINHSLMSILLWTFSQWRPQEGFSFKSFRELFGFGSKLLTSSLITSLYANLYTLSIGKFFQSKELGLFNRATTIVNLPSSNITEVVTRVTYPVQCELQNNNDVLYEKFMTYISLISYIVFPLMIGLSILSRPLVELILTKRWIECVPLINLLCFAYLLQPVMAMNWQLLNVKHRSDLALKSEIIKKIIAITVLLITLQFNVKIMCIGLILYSIIDMIVITHFTQKVLAKVTLKEEFKRLFPIFLLAISMGIFILAINHLIDFKNNIFLIGIDIILGILFYISVSYVFKIKELKILIKKL